MARLWTFRIAFLVLWWCWGAAAQEAEMVVFDLVPAAATNHSMPGVMALSFGSPPQEVDVLVAFYTNSEAAVHVPVRSLCSISDNGVDKGWNSVTEPFDGEFVSTARGSSPKIVRWQASPGSNTLNLSLRKGKGEDSINVFGIERNIANNGEYSWDVRSTFTQQNLTAASDYYLMLWSENPPRQSVSGYFSLGLTGNDTDSEVVTKSKNCLEYLRLNGGYYDPETDEDFTAEISLEGSIRNSQTAFRVEKLAVGSTSLSWSSWSAGSNSAFQLQGLPVNLIYQSSLGMGIVGLNVLQRARNSRIPEMDIVALNLGTANQAGSVVMGGYDNALIDKNQKTIFGKSKNGGFEVAMTGIAYVGSSFEKTIASNPASSSESKIGLAYDSPNIQLSAEALQVLLPLIGSPEFDEDLNGYFYSRTPKTDYSLRFTLEGTNPISIIVPASSLLATDTSLDNPLTPKTESGRTYLRLSSSSNGHPAYLGRAFLQHVYLINSPSTISNFHISAIPSPLPIAKSLVPASRDSVSIFSTTTTEPNNDQLAVGPMVGGILGGLAAIIGGVAVWIYIQRRKQDRGPSRSSGRLTVRFTEDKNSNYDTEGAFGSSTRGTPSGSKTPALSPITFSCNASPATFSRNASPFSVPPPRSPQKSPEPPMKDPEHIQRPATMKRRQSENSTVARLYMGPYSPQIGDLEELQHEMQLQRTATIGRFYSAGRVSKVDSPTIPQQPEVARTKSHVRTASIGRVCSPTSVEFSPVNSRRGSMKMVDGELGHIKTSSVDSSDKEEMVIKEEEEVGVKHQKKNRWSNSTKLTSTSDQEESDESSVFGLDAVAMDGSEFLAGMTKEDGDDSKTDDHSR